MIMCHMDVKFLPSISKASKTIIKAITLNFFKLIYQDDYQNNWFNILLIQAIYTHTLKYQLPERGLSLQQRYFY